MTSSPSPAEPRFSRAERCTIAIAAVFAALAAVVGLAGAGEGSANPLGYYVGFVVGPVWKAALFALLAYLLVALARLSLWFVRLARRGEPVAVLPAMCSALRGARAEAASFALGFLLPVAVLLEATFVMGELNAANAARLKDALFLGWDRALFGGTPFADWGLAGLPGWLAASIAFGFKQMPLFLIAFGLWLFRSRRELLGELGAAFALTILLMFPAWVALPALSPHDRYLDNVYGGQVPPDVAEAVGRARYHPAVSGFLADMRASKAGLRGAYPTTTFPSAHAAWGTLLAAYAYRALRRRYWVLLAAIALLSTLGTFLLVQHYVVDAPAGVAVGALSAWIAFLLRRRR